MRQESDPVLRLHESVRGPLHRLCQQSDRVWDGTQVWGEKQQSAAWIALKDSFSLILYVLFSIYFSTETIFGGDKS